MRQRWFGVVRKTGGQKLIYKGDNLGYYTGPDMEIRAVYVSHCVIMTVTSRGLLLSEQVATLERQGMHT